jgi:mRNA interferase RelE/StbE
MGIRYSIYYHKKVVEQDIPLLDNVWKIKIKGAIEQKLTAFPETFGRPLRRSLRGYRKLRVGDYRVIFRIEGKKIKIIVIGHRSWAYQEAEIR